MTVMVLVPLPPTATDSVFGEAVSVKLPKASTVNVIVVVAFRLPDVPVMVTVTVPAFAVLLAVNVSTLDEVAGFGLNEPVTPLGNVEVVSVTLPENPLTGVMVMLLVPLAPPFAMVTAVGDAESVKLCTRACTVRLIVVLLVKLPDVPVIVTVTVPVAAVELAVKVKVLTEVVGFGLKAAVTPLGSPEAERVTLPLKPFTGVMVMVLVALLPWVMTTLLGLAERLKLGAPPGQAFTRL